MANRYEKLALQIFNQFLRRFCARISNVAKKAEMASVTTISLNDVPESHRPFIVDSAMLQLARKRHQKPRRSKGRHDVAILATTKTSRTNPATPAQSSALRCSLMTLSINTEIIDKNDYGRLGRI
ncbi:MAG: hypothetical protein IPP14_15535 [Planctomycetes bacterium]|nr:hypothetical protein [Planctomycetota bacterium]